jgi:ATP-dependent DNA ligase
LTWRFPLIVEGLAGLRLRSCVIDGEAVALSEDGIANFERIQCRHNGWHEAISIPNGAKPHAQTVIRAMNRADTAGHINNSGLC